MLGCFDLWQVQFSVHLNFTHMWVVSVTCLRYPLSSEHCRSVGVLLNSHRSICVASDLFLPRSFFSFAFPRMQRFVARNRARNSPDRNNSVSSKHGEEGKVLLLLLQYQQTVPWLLSAAQQWMTCVASQSNPNKAKGEEESSHFHEADGGSIVVPPVASNPIEFQTHWKRLRRNKQCLVQLHVHIQCCVVSLYLIC